MGQKVARKDRVDSVYSPHGTGYECQSPTTQKTNEGSSDVFINGTGVVREGDAMTTHPQPGCTPHTPKLTTHSGTVFANGKGVGRVGDSYSGHPILTGSPNVYAGG